MNEPNKQPSNMAPEVEQAMVRIEDLCQKAFRDGYAAGYGKGFEYGVMAVSGRMVREQTQA
jgi:hypothetical protein